MQDRATLRSDPIGMDSSRLFYGIDFCSDGIGYFCDIDAATGDITAAGREIGREQNPDSSNSEASKISASEAKAAALDFAGLKESEVDYIAAETDTIDGYRIYGVDFFKDGIEYYTGIDAQTGDVFIAYWRIVTEESAADMAMSEELTEEEAAEIALWYLGLEEMDIDAVYAEAGLYDGYPEYYVEILCDDILYTCDIDMETGDVIAAGWSWVRPSRKEAAAAPVKAGKKLY